MRRQWVKRPSASWPDSDVGRLTQMSTAINSFLRERIVLVILALGGTLAGIAW